MLREEEGGGRSEEGGARRDRKFQEVEELAKVGWTHRISKAASSDTRHAGNEDWNNSILDQTYRVYFGTGHAPYAVEKYHFT